MEQDRYLFWASSRHRRAETKLDKLSRYELPVFDSEKALAAWLGIPLSRLRWFTHNKETDTVWHYVAHSIPKRSGGERLILAPKKELKALQRQVLHDLLDKVPLTDAVHGFVRGRGIVTNGLPHIGKAVLLNLDLKDFFPSIIYPRVRGLFISLGYSFSVASTLALLCTGCEREAFDDNGTRYYISVDPRHLVQGAPTSPALANLIAYRLDRRLTGLANKHNFTYTRYADDLTFSGSEFDTARRLLGIIPRIVEDENFTINESKTRILRASSRQTVTGLVVNDQLSTPRQLRRRLRAILHNAQTTGLDAQNRDNHEDFNAYLLGMIAFVKQANAEQAEPLKKALSMVQTKANPTPWQAQLLRLTLFLSPAAQVVEPTWWHDLVGESPETIISRPREGTRQESGPWGNANLTLLLQPTRIDWLLTAEDDDNSKASVMGGTFQEKLCAFKKLMSRWFEFSTCPAAQRLAFGAVLLKAVESQEDGLRQLSNLLPVELDPDGSKDFSYQINRPRPPHAEIAALWINRLSKWAIISPAQVTNKEFACRLELDINTVPDFQGELPRESFAQLFGELAELGQEIAQKGDIP